MAYNPTVYANDNPPALSADNLNKSEQELAYLDHAIDDTNIINSGTNINIKEHGVLETGNNIYDPNTENRIAGYYVANNNGKKITSATYTSVGLLVKGGEAISINAKDGFVTFFSNYSDIRKVTAGAVVPGFISGIVITASGSGDNISIPNNAYMMVISFATSKFATMQVEYGATLSTYFPYETHMDGNLLSDNSVGIEKLNGIEIITGKNIFNKNTSNKKTGVYCTTAGKLSSAGTYNCYAIPVEGGKKFSANTVEAFFCFFEKYIDISGYAAGSTIPGLISGYSGSSQTNVTIPSGAKMLLLSIQASRESQVQVEYGSAQTPYENYYDGIDGSVICKRSIPADRIVQSDKTIIMKANGLGDYSNLRECFEAIVAMGNYSHVDVLLYPGTYDIRACYTNVEWEEQYFTGLYVPHDVSLIGVGDRKENIVITCTSEFNTNQISTLNVRYNNEFKNLTIYGENVRYAIHDDFSNYDVANTYGISLKAENVDFIGKNMQYNYVYGEGTRGGSYKEFKDCRFINKSDMHAYSCHDLYENKVSVLSEIHVFENCEFIGKKGRLTIRLNQATSGVDQVFVFNGCIIPSMRITSSQTGGENATSIFKIVGHGNSSDMDVSFGIARDYLAAPKFGDKAKAGINTAEETISYGNYVKFEDNGIVKGTENDNIGIAINTSVNGGVVYYQ